MKIALVARHAMHPARSAGHFALDQHCADRNCDDHAQYVASLGTALAGLGHRVTIYTRRNSAGLPDAAKLAAGCTMRYLTAGPPAPEPAGEPPQHLGVLGSELADRWSQATPDIVHAFDWTSGIASTLATRVAQVPVVQTFSSLAATEQRRGVTAPPRPLSARARMEASLARGAAGLIATSTDEAADLSALGESNVTVVPAGVDPAAFARRGLAARRSSTARLVHVGPLDQDEGAQILISALAWLPEAELVIAGGPARNLEDSADYDRLAKQAADLGVAHRVSFSGRVGPAGMPSLLRSATALVSAARHVPLGLAALAAMSGGVPVIGYDVGAHGDAVISGTTGVLVPAGRPDRLVRALRDTLAAPTKLTAFGIAAADRATSRYPWDRIAAETVAAYRHCIENPRGNHGRSRNAASADSALGGTARRKLRAA